MYHSVMCQHCWLEAKAKPGIQHAANTLKAGVCRGLTYRLCMCVAPPTSFKLHKSGFAAC